MSSDINQINTLITFEELKQIDYDTGKKCFSAR